MSFKRRALGLGIVAVVATAGLAANASATSGGHFAISAAHSTIFGTQLNEHRLEYLFHGLEGGIVCDSAKYEGTATASTVTELDLRPTYSGCHTTGSATNIPIHVNGCLFRLTVAPGAEPEQTVDLVCSFGKAIEITHPNCTITILPQASGGGATYTTTEEIGTHKLTVDANLQFNVEFHGGICVFTGTNHTGTLAGSMTVNADTTELKTLDLTAT